MTIIVVGLVLWMRDHLFVAQFYNFVVAILLYTIDFFTDIILAQMNRRAADCADCGLRNFRFDNGRRHNDTFVRNKWFAG